MLTKEKVIEISKYINYRFGTSIASDMIVISLDDRIKECIRNNSWIHPENISHIMDSVSLSLINMKFPLLRDPIEYRDKFYKKATKAGILPISRKIFKHLC